MPTNTSSQGGTPGAEVIQHPRRSFLAKLITMVCWGAAYAAPTIAGAVAFLNPLRVKSQAGRALRLGSLEALPADGTPRKFPVIMDRSDAWNRFPNEPVGAVMLRRAGDGQVEALNVVCPHAGCSVQYEPGPGKFFCPCHGATFDLSGKRLDKTSPSPRDLDTLEVEIRNGTEVWVHFQDFRPGIAEKVPEA
jgi:menaquinol-cytochrome c reductase iron-sulfur subunit